MRRVDLLRTCGLAAAALALGRSDVAAGLSDSDARLLELSTELTDLLVDRYAYLLREAA